MASASGLSSAREFLVHGDTLEGLQGTIESIRQKVSKPGGTQFEVVPVGKPVDNKGKLSQRVFIYKASDLKEHVAMTPQAPSQNALERAQAELKEAEQHLQEARRRLEERRESEAATPRGAAMDVMDATRRVACAFANLGVLCRRANKLQAMYFYRRALSCYKSLGPSYEAHTASIKKNLQLLTRIGNPQGFGIMFKQATRGGPVAVKNLVPGGPAERNGQIQPDDIIQTVGSVSVKGAGIATVCDRIEASGTKLSLTVLRLQEGKPQLYTVVLERPVAPPTPRPPPPDTASNCSVESEEDSDFVSALDNSLRISEDGDTQNSRTPPFLSSTEVDIDTDDDDDGGEFWDDDLVTMRSPTGKQTVHDPWHEF